MELTVRDSGPGQTVAREVPRGPLRARPLAPAAAGLSVAARWAAPTLVLIMTALAFLPVLHNGFIPNWDDRNNFLANADYRGLGWAQLRWMFTAFHMGHYIPLTWVSLGLDYLIWGMDPRGYHLTSLLLHAATALAFYFLSLRLLGLARPESRNGLTHVCGAAAAALLFAVHPLRVESVAWVTARRDVLSAFFYVCAITAYLKAVAPRDRARRGWYWGAVALFACALLSKSITVSLPVVLLALDVYPLGRLGGGRRRLETRVWLEKVPFFILAAAATVMAFLALLPLGNMRSLESMSLGIRVLLSVYGLAFYLGRTLLPLGLSPLYPLSAVQLTWLEFGAILGTVSVGAILAVAMRRRWPAFTAAAVVYAVTVFPVLGIFHNGPQAVADRYSYLACLPWALLAGAAAGPRWRGAWIVRAVLAAVILALGALTWQQAEVWHDAITLWAHAASLPSGGLAAHANLADSYVAAGRIADAIPHYREALRRSPDQAGWHVKIGQVYEDAGQPGAALEEFRAARRLAPASREACDGLRRLAGRLAVPRDALDGCPR